MDIKNLSESLSVCPQISPDDIKAIKDLGFASIICNRPDGEADDQPGFEQMAETAHILGVKISYIPVIGGQISDEDVALFETTTDHLPKPILAYCRTGTRCTILWSLCQAEQQPVEDILQTAQAAGYDMSGQTKRINNIRENQPS